MSRVHASPAPRVSPCHPWQRSPERSALPQPGAVLRGGGGRGGLRAGRGKGSGRLGGELGPLPARPFPGASRGAALRRSAPSGAPLSAGPPRTATAERYGGGTGGAAGGFGGVRGGARRRWDGQRIHGGGTDG